MLGIITRRHGIDSRDWGALTQRQRTDKNNPGAASVQHLMVNLGFWGPKHQWDVVQRGAKDLAPSPVTSFLCGPGPVSPLTEGLGLAFYNVQVLDGTVKGPSCAERPGLSGAKGMAPGKAAQRPWLRGSPRELGHCLPILVPNPCVQLTPCSLLKIPNPDSTQDSLHLNLWHGLPGKLTFSNPTLTWLGDSSVHRSLSV